MPSSAMGLPRLDGLPAFAESAFGLITGARRAVGVSTVAASSFNKGARRPGTQSVAVLIHLLVA